MDWYIARGEKKYGPFNDEALGRSIESGKVLSSDRVWREGFVNWVPVRDVPGLLSPPPIPASAAQVRGQAPRPSPASAPQQSDARVDSETGRPVAETRSGESARAKVGGSYVARHWRGDLSLGVSYWVNVILLTVVFTILLAIPSRVANEQVVEAPRLVSAFGILVWCIAVALSVWQFVGVWRSADKHKSRGGRPFWAVTARVVVVLGVLLAVANVASLGVPQAREHWKILAGAETRNYELRLLRDSSELEISGFISFGLTDDVSRLLDAHPTVTLVHLNSAGGRVAEARALRDLIERRRLATYVANQCLSACVLAFAAGERRLIARGAKLGLHQYAFPGMEQRHFDGEYAKDRAYLRARRVSEEFIERAFSTPSSSMWMPTHQELISSALVTGYAGSSDVAWSGVRREEVEQIDAQLASVPLFAALREVEPELYEKIRDELKEGLLRGRTLADVRATTMPAISAVYKKRVSRASDAAIRDFTALVVDQLDALRLQNPRLCYEYAFEPDGRPPSVQVHLPKPLLQREMEVGAAVIISSAKGGNPLPSEDAATPILESVIRGLGRRFSPSDLQLLAAPTAPGVSPTKMCDITIALYSDILALPPQRGAVALRYMFAQ